MQNNASGEKDSPLQAKVSIGTRRDHVLTWICAHWDYTIALVLVSCVRMYIGGIVPLRANASAKNTLDDYLMVEYAQLQEHFQSSANTWVLAKAMSFSYLLNILTKLGIRYTTFVSLLWIVSALMVVSAIRRIWNRCNDQYGNVLCLPYWIFAVIYVFLVFCPTAFDKDTGTRIYRESFVAPTVMLLAGLSLLLILAAIDTRTRAVRWITARELLWGVLLGVAWCFFWFLKESGIWLAPALIVVLAIAAYCHISGMKRYRANAQESAAHASCSSHAHVMWGRAVSAICMVAVPLVVFAAGNATYRGINERYFGVPYASVRTEGAIAGFFERLYAIDGPGKTEEHWVPWSVMEQAINASPTLQSHPELVDALKHGVFVDDVDGMWEMGPHHDMAVWTMMDALARCGLYPDQEAPQRLFEQINNELDQASLPHVDGFTFSASLVPKTLTDIWDLRQEWWASFESTVLWKHYVVADDDFESPMSEQNSRVRLMELTLNETLGRADDPVTSRNGQHAMGLLLARGIVAIYRYIAPIGVAIAGCGIVLAGTQLVRWRHIGESDRKRALMMFWTAFACAGCSFALVLAVSWLCSGRTTETFAYYTAAAVPLIQLTEIVAALCCINAVVSLFQRRTQ